MTTLTKRQVKTYGPKPISGYGPEATITAKVRYDDECGNGRNTFAITASIKAPKPKGYRGHWDPDIAGGCLHEDIARAFPELTPFIKWHLVSSDGPMHYIANAIFHASNRDHRGLLKGEKRQLRNGKTGLAVWERIVRNEKGEKASISGWVDADEKPSETLTVDFEPVWIVGEGKERQLDFARSSAVWPEATDEELTSPDLEEKLKARLPQLMEDFQKAVESLGFTF